MASCRNSSTLFEGVFPLAQWYLPSHSILLTHALDLLLLALVCALSFVSRNKGNFHQKCFMGVRGSWVVGRNWRLFWNPPWAQLGPVTSTNDSTNRCHSHLYSPVCSQTSSKISSHLLDKDGRVVASIKILMLKLISSHRHLDNHQMTYPRLAQKRERKMHGKKLEPTADTQHWPSHKYKPAFQWVQPPTSAPSRTLYNNCVQTTKIKNSYTWKQYFQEMKLGRYFFCYTIIFCQIIISTDHSCSVSKFQI